MNYLERLALEIESRTSQLKTLKQRNAEMACLEIEKEIECLKHELQRYQTYEAEKAHQIYSAADH